MRGACRTYLPLVGRLVKRPADLLRGEAEPVGVGNGLRDSRKNPHPDACGIVPPHKGEGWL